MKITALETIHVDGGWAVFSYLKVSTDVGLVGWAEFSGYDTIPAVIRSMSARVLGRDPTHLNEIDALLYTLQRPAPGGLVARAAGAILNACLDLTAKSLGLPVHRLLGGAVRERVPVYWSHCGLFRLAYANLFETVIGKPAVRTLDDLRRCGEEVAAAGYRALKTNLLRFDGARPAAYSPGIGRGSLWGHPELNIDERIIGALVRQLEALRAGAGKDVALLVDLNFNYKPEGFRRLARAVEPFNLMWLEMDMTDPQALAGIRNATHTPIGSLEMLLGRRNIRPFLDAGAVDVAIVDPQWNGVLESVKMAQLADVYDVNVAAHCSAGPLGALMSAHFCAVIPNLRIMEYEADMVPWGAQLLTTPSRIDDGDFVLSDAPGWGADIDEAIARAHPGDNGPSGKRNA
jgi:L-alanine-DL-glutamate epimerase-like enolase superfamily enzyme